MEPRQHFYESQRLRLSYWSWGDEAAPPLVLVHGGRDHARAWDGVAAAFADGHHVVAPDLRGHGDSQWAIGSEYPLRQNLLDLVALVDLLGGRVSVVGHSFGGQLSLITAGTFPERFDALVAIEGTRTGVSAERERTTPDLMRRWSASRRALEGREPHVYLTLEAARDRMLEANAHLTPEQAMDLAAYGARAVEGGYVWKFDNYARPGVRAADLTRDEALEFYAAIDCPVLLIDGGDSQGADGGDGRARWFKRARSTVVPDAGHWVHHDQPAAVVREIRSHLEGVRRESEAAG